MSIKENPGGVATSGVLIAAERRSTIPCASSIYGLRHLVNHLDVRRLAGVMADHAGLDLLVAGSATGRSADSGEAAFTKEESRETAGTQNPGTRSDTDVSPAGKDKDCRCRCALCAFCHPARSTGSCRPEKGNTIPPDYSSGNSFETGTAVSAQCGTGDVRRVV